jgi:tetratricopeptide (TPR) repeat protein
MMEPMHEQHSELLRAVDPAELGARVRAARVGRGLTQTELGGDGVSTGYISRIESGARRPTLAVLTTLAQRLGTTTEQLLRGVPRSECDEIRLLLNYAELALETGEAADAETQARSALQRAITADQCDLRRRAKLLLGRSVEVQGRLDEAITIYEELAAKVTGLPLAECGIALTRCHKEVGDLALAIEVGERIGEQLHADGLGYSDEAVRLAVTVAGAYIERGDLNRALRVCSRALDTAEQTESREARAAAYWNTSIARSLRGETSEAVELAERALSLLSEGADRRNLARLRLQIGRLMLRESDPAVGHALEHLTRARHELAESSGSRTDISRADVSVAQAHLAAGDPARALELAQAAYDAAPSTSALVRIDCLITVGQARAALGEVDAARDDFRAAAHHLVGVGAQREAAQVWCDLAELLAQVDDAEGSTQALRAAVAASGLTPRVGLRRVDWASAR